MITTDSMTLWHEGVDPATRMNTYTVQKFPKISIQHDNLTQLTDGGIKSANVLKIRIPTDAEIKIKNGDKLVIGLSNEKKPPVKDSYTVMGFADNRKGSKSMHHWKVVAG